MNPRYRSSAKIPPKISSTANNRARRLQWLVLLIGFVLVVRLFYLQIIQHDHYNQLALAEHQKKLVLPSSRGELYFRDGDVTVPAVLNTTVYTLYADPNEVKDHANVSEIIARHLKINKEDVLVKLNAKNTAYSVIAKRLSRDAVNDLFRDKNKLIGVNVTPVPQRVYPEGLLGAQVLGFVNDNGVGQYGVEGALNSTLAGKPGMLKAVTDVNGVPLSLDDATDVARAPQNGQSMVLTIDRNIQAKAEQALNEGLKKVGATKGGVVIIDPNTGAIKAMANLPSYDPAKYFEVGGDAYQRFQNRVISDPYEAGSVIKVLTVASGLNDGAVHKNDRFNNTGSIKVDDATISNVEQDVNGSRSITDILKYSLNTGVVYVLSQLGGGQINTQARQKLYSYFTDRYGFGQVTGVEQTGESPGSIYGPRTTQGNNVRYANMAFGQGMNVTMIQVASAFSAIINNGTYYAPHVIEGNLHSDGSTNSQPPKPLRTHVVSSETSATIREMTRQALAETPSLNNLMKSGYTIGGKTGTSQIIDPNTGKYSNLNAIGSYLGYAADGGTDRPRYVIMVRVDDAKLSAADFAGGSAAAPIFANINNWLLTYYNVKPR